ncbi:hypothetical protein MKW94_022098 [Papaver nudicaule]|uniref:Uncharacterized protein n=1 Tax=Papaver nudicaule TaxID=74823 RepID=A0AA41VIS4_PAPNU|nr:hypothetical protein [Papaver nudicaule]
MVKRKRCQKPQTPSMEDLRTKLSKIDHHHRQLKSSFHTLKSEIKTGFFEAEDVFHSMSVPLMKLVALKTDEMAEEGASSTFYSDSSQLSFQHRSNVVESESSNKSRFPAKERDQVKKMKKLISKEEENYSGRVRKAGNEIMEKQRVQLQKLVHLLRQIEIHVNTRQNDILESLNQNAHSIHSIFQKSASYLANVHRIDQTKKVETTELIVMMSKLLKIIFERTNLVTESVEDGVRDLIRELAEHMCNPMVDYVQEIKAEIATGSTLKKLIDVVGEMERAIVDGRSKLEEAKKEVRIEKVEKFEVLGKLKELEEKRLKESEEKRLKESEARRLKELEEKRLKESEKKLSKIVHHHGQLKTSFHVLKSQIKTGLLEAEEVFTSLSVPLMKLVGLKTEEMAEEGRSSTFYMESDSPQLNLQHQRNIFMAEIPGKSPFPAEKRDQVHQMEEENYSERVKKAGNEAMEKQRVQLQKLVYLLRKIEIHVNTRQDDILETLNHQANSIRSIFRKSASYLTNVHRIDQTANNHLETTTLIVTVLKLLKGIFEQMNLVTGSVEDGVQDLVRELAEHMCNPMVDYVQEIKAEMAAGGTLKKLIDVMSEMERVIVDGRSKLEEAKNEVRVEQARKFDALRRLKESEEKRLALNELLGFLLKTKENSKEPFLLQHKLAALEEDQILDERVRSQLKTALRDRNNQVQSKFPTSPTGELLKIVPAAPGKKTPEQIISRGNYQNKISMAVVEPVVIDQNLRRTTGSVTQTLRNQMGTPGNPSANCSPMLGSSSAGLVDHFNSIKRICRSTYLPQRKFVFKHGGS